MWSEERDAGNLPDEQEPDDLDDLAEEPDAGDGPELDAGDEPEGDEADAEPAARPEARRPGRRERQTAELRELRERVERQERELQGVRGQQQQPRADNSAELARVAAYERDQLPLLPADQIASYYHNKQLRIVGDALARQEVTLTDRLDKSSWDSACRTSARRERFAAQVEDTLRSERQQGRNPERETIYRYLLGDEIERQAGRRAPGQRQAAARRVRSQATQPGGSRSDVARDRQPAATGQDYEGAMARTRGKPLWQ
jgi:hypothetical protein